MFDLCVTISVVFPDQMASIRVELNQLREDLDGCVQKQEFERAAEIKTKVIQ